MVFVDNNKKYIDSQSCTSSVKNNNRKAHTFKCRHFLSSDRIWITCLICSPFQNGFFSLPSSLSYSLYHRSKDSNGSFTYKGMISLPQPYKWWELSGVMLLVLLACCTIRRVNNTSVVSKAGRHYSHFHQHSCSGNVSSGSLISGLILLRAPCFATDLSCCQRQGPHFSGLLLVIVDWH